MDAIKEVVEISVEIVKMRQMLEYSVETNKVLLLDNEKLYEMLISANSKVQDLEASLKHAQKLYYCERQKVKSLIKKNTALINKLEHVKDTVTDKCSYFPFTALGREKLETIFELDNTDSLMSDLSYTLDEEDITGCSTDVSLKTGQGSKRSSFQVPSDEKLDSRELETTQRQLRAYTAGQETRVTATTTVTVPRKGPVTATSVIETFSPIQQLPDIPSFGSPSTPCTPSTIRIGSTSATPSTIGIASTSVNCNKSTDRRESPGSPSSRSGLRLHAWNQTSRVICEACPVCTMKIKFPSVAYKCANCKAIVHTKCKDEAPLPCVPVRTNSPKSSKGTIAEFVPKSSPMVPALVVHCVGEIESRGLSNPDLYRGTGSHQDILNLKDRLIKAKGVVQLSDVPDINTVCGCLKEFLKSLKESLIPKKKWKEFAAAAEILNGEERKNRLLQFLQSLPQPNRDTLSYITLHLQKVAASPSCQMSVANLSKMFGPTIVGFSDYTCDDFFQNNITIKIMAELLLLPAECWEELLNQDDSAIASGFFSDTTPQLKFKKKKEYFFTS